MTMLAFGAFISIILSWLLSGWLRRYALSSSHLLDLPNERSSHSMPTPRGGGVAIVLTFAALMISLDWSGRLPPQMLQALLGSGLVVALAGFLDDHRPLPARWRFLAHLAAAVWALWCMRGIPSVPILGGSFDQIGRAHV